MGMSAVAASSRKYCPVGTEAVDTEGRSRDCVDSLVVIVGQPLLVVGKVLKLRSRSWNPAFHRQRSRCRHVLCTLSLSLGIARQCAH